ncbi:MAG: hypothetical protein WC438_03840 [Candidatus Pacearchaeota archaeon]
MDKLEGKVERVKQVTNFHLDLNNCIYVGCGIEIAFAGAHNLAQRFKNAYYHLLHIPHKHQSYTI